MSKIERKIAALPNARRIPKRWHDMKAAKEKRHGNTEWKKNPIKVVDTPAAVEVFRQLDKGLRSRMFRIMASKVEFDPKKLVTYQPCVAAAAILQFAKDEKLSRSKKAYVLGTEHGPTIWNGNHRAVAALLTGRKFRAIYLDLVGNGVGSKKKKS